MIKARDYDVYEILDEIEKLSTFEDKVNQLREKFFDHSPLHRILKFNFCSSIKSVVPEGAPPFNDEPSENGARTSLWQYLTVFPIFVESTQSMRMKPLQIERQLIEMLESIDPDEARMVILAKDRRLGEKWGITSEIAKAAFPQLNIVTAEDVVEKDLRTKEEKAEEMANLAELKKQQAKDLNAEARKLIAEAKKLAAEV